MNEMSENEIVVIKKNIAGKETWRYKAILCQQSPDEIVLEARFNREDKLIDRLLMQKDDRFVETYYFDRWYNIIEIHDGVSDQLKGWYCDICYPPIFKEGELSYVDLALDLLVYPDGRQVLLDEDELAELNLDEATQKQVWRALDQLKAHFAQHI